MPGPDDVYVTFADADTMMREVIVSYEEALNAFLNKHKIPITQYQYDALISFTYNYGVEWWESIPEKVLPNYIRKGNGIYYPAKTLSTFEQHDNVDRRRREASLFSYGTYS